MSRLSRLAPVLVVAAILMVELAAPAIAQPGLPREETIYAGGGLWAPPSNFNPLVPWATTTGTIGLIYEPLFLYKPFKNEFVPWLAASGRWLDAKRYEVKLRDAKWQDGKPVTSDDVRFTFEIAKEGGFYYSGIWDWLDHIETPDEKTVIFVFKNPHYPEWDYFRYTIAIVPRHVWEGKENPLQDSNENPVGSGMYRLKGYDQNQVVYERDDNWWGIEYFGKPGPRYIVYMRVASNNVALAMLVRSEIDWSNFFLPGVPQLVKKYSFIKTWYKDKPYYLPANVAFLFLNNQKYPLNVTEFRRAMAYAINVQQIVDRVYEGAVLPSNPVGFLPIPAWQKYYAEDVVAEKGFKYDPEKAKEILDRLGFRDVDGDGLREAPSGDKVKLTIIVPYGWTDWMEAARIIAEDLRAVGIDVEAKFPDFSKYYDDLTKGEFDLAINNFNSMVSPSPWTMYNWIFYVDVPPVGKNSYSGNFGRYKNAEVAELLEKILVTPDTEEAKLKEYYRRLQEIFLEDLPYIPLWYNAFWYQASTKYWTNWPDADNPYAVPVTWTGNWQLGGMITLLHLKPAGQQQGGEQTQPSQQPSQPSQPSQPAQPAQPAPNYSLYIGAIAVIAIIAAAAWYLARKRSK